MAVQNQTPVASFTTSGVTKVFPFAFMLLDADDLVVTLDGVVVSSGFSIAGIAAPAGGSVVFATAPSAGQLLVLRRNIALQRLNDYQRNGDLLSQVLNLDLDRIWQALQGLRQDSSRAIKLPESTLTDQTITDDAATRAGKVVGFDSSGNAVAVALSDPDTLMVSAFIETLLSAADAETARETLGAVGSTGAETVDGVKTFTSSPIIPDASDDQNPVSKAQLDAESVARAAAISAAVLPATLAPSLRVDIARQSLTGSAVTLGPFPAWVSDIIVHVSGVSTDGTGIPMLQVGTGGTPTWITTGYAGATMSVASGSAVGVTNPTDGVRMATSFTAGRVTHGILRLSRIDYDAGTDTDTWMVSGVCNDSSSGIANNVSYTVSFSGALTNVRIAATTGNLDAGAASAVGRA